MPRKERRRKEAKRSYRRIKGRKRKISTSSEEDEEPWNTSLAVHERPEGENEEFLCPYFDGSKLILPPGYEDYKKKVEKEDDTLSSDRSRTTSTDGAPLRRSSRKTKTRKRMYIYSDDSSSGFEDSKISAAVASGTPVPTCMFVNAGVTGGSGIDVNKDVFKSLPQTKAFGTSASQSVDDERIEFTIEINETSDEESGGQTEGVEGSRIKRTVNLSDESENIKSSNVNGLNETNTDTKVETGPDIKIKDDPIFLSDDEVISRDSVKVDSESKVTGEEKECTENSTCSRQEDMLESETKNDEETKKRDSPKDSVTQGSVDFARSETIKGETSMEESKTYTAEDAVDSVSNTDGDISLPLNALSDNIVSKNDRCLLDKSGNELPTAEENKLCKETEIAKVVEKDEKSCSDNSSDLALNNEAESIRTDELSAAESVNNSLLHTGIPEKDVGNVGHSDGKQAPNAAGCRDLKDTEEIKSEGGDTEKTEEFEPEPEHALITEIKDRMRGYCSERVEFVETLELSGNLTINADNEKPIRGSVAQTISKDNSTVVKDPVPTVCVPQELSNLVQKLCKERLQYDVELLIQGELYATIDGTLVSTICNFSFEPEEDDF